MLNVFPIQFLAPIAYLLLRVVLGFVCIRIGLHLFKKENPGLVRRGIGAGLTITGTLFLIGLFTQIASLATLALLSIGNLRQYRLPNVSRTSLFLICTIALALFITGSGPFAFDLPI